MAHAIQEKYFAKQAFGSYGSQDGHPNFWMLSKLREAQNWYLSHSVLQLQGPQSDHFVRAEIDTKDSLEKKPVVTWSEVYFILLSIAYGRSTLSKW